MKTISLTTLAGLAAVLLFANPRAQAQAEVNPDHYEVTEPDSVSQKADMDTHAIVHYEGKVTLPHRIHCEGKSLPPRRVSGFSRLRGKDCPVHAEPQR